jgi:pyruvate/2-oxoglutarate dehydrogenase complex dihydrolipoamide dehydrogenase (E3) component
MSLPTESYDLISIGSGEAGKIIAWTIASQGKRCAVVEERWLGGSCPNVACLPSKNIIHSANVVHDARSSIFGLQANSAAVDMAVVRDRKHKMINGLLDMHRSKFKGSGAELIMGHGVFVGNKTIEVSPTGGGERRRLEAKVVIIGTGSRARIDDKIPGLKEANPLTHIEVLEIDHVPKHLIILGGGYVGLEFAQGLQRLGSKVTIIERNNRILKQEDEDVSSLLKNVLISEGVDILTGFSVNSVTGKSGEHVKLELTGAGIATTLEGSHILVATGRIPNTDGIGLELTGVELTPSGHVKVDEHLRTTCADVYAVGDCAGSPLFTHIGFDDFRIVVDVLKGSQSPRSTANRQVPSTLFTTPEVAHVGLREEEAKKQNITYRLAKVPMMAFLRSRTLDQTTGFAKALISEDNLILGFTACGPSAGELLPVVQLAMVQKLPYTAISGLIITHPTMSEGLISLFSSVPSK